MIADRREAVHKDFRLSEREADEQADPALLRGALRTAYVVPNDTFVTGELPLLLTRLAKERP